MSSKLTTNIIIILVTFVIAAFFVASEFALVSVRKSQLEEALENDPSNRKKIERALHMVTNLNEYLSTTQVGISAIGIILGWIGESTIEEILEVMFGHAFGGGTSVKVVSSILGILILTYLEVVFTEIIPKNISIDRPLQTMMAIVNPLYYFHRAAYPFVWILNKSSETIVRWMGLEPASSEDSAYSQTEILNLSQTAVSSGNLDRDDYIYMERAFELNDKVAKDIMVDRTRLYVVDMDNTVSDVLNDYLKTGYSRIPVVKDGDKDHVLGYVYSYDLVKQARVDKDIPINKILRSVTTIPETMPIHDILSKMIHQQAPLVVVVDEYGGTSGIVTDNDIYEELFGTVNDEIDDVSDDYIIEKEDEKDVYRVSGKTTLYDIERFFRIDVPEFEDSDIITIGGYVMENYPDTKQGTKLTIGPLELTVTDFDHSFPNWFDGKKINHDYDKPEELHKDEEDKQKNENSDEDNKKEE